MENNVIYKTAIFVFLTLILGTACSSTFVLAEDNVINEGEDIATQDTLASELIEISNYNPLDIPFGVGERLRFHMDFSFVKAGISEMSIMGIDTSTGSPAYHFRSRVKSTKGVDLFYKVRDVVESWFEIETLSSIRFEKRVREGSYRSKKFYDYNNETGYVAISNENGPKGVEAFTPNSHNIISALYWVRAQDLKEGQELSVNLHDAGVQYPLTIKVYGKEKIKVPAGTFDCWKVEPLIESEGLFKMAGRLIVWISDDEHRLPIQMNSKIPVGSIDGHLVEYRLGQPYSPDVKAPQDGTDEKWDW